MPRNVRVARLLAVVAIAATAGSLSTVSASASDDGSGFDSWSSAHPSDAPPGAEPGSGISAPVKPNGEAYSQPKSRISDPALAASHTLGAEDDASPISPTGQYVWSPADPTLAAGSSYLVEVANSELAVWAKTSTSSPATGPVSLKDFFGWPDDGCRDTQVIHISWQNRFALVCWDSPSSVNATGSDSVRVAVSKTSDPRLAANWYTYQIISAQLDQVKALATSDKFIVSGNNGNYTYFYVASLTSVINNTAPSWVFLSVQQTTIAPAVVQYVGASVPSTAYYVRTCAGCGLNLYNVSGTPTAPTVTAMPSLGADLLTNITSNPAVPGGTINAGIVGTRVTGASYSVRSADGHPVVAWTGVTACPANTSRICAYMDRYDLTNGTLRQGTYDNVDGDTLFPGTAYDTTGVQYISYSYSNSSYAPGAAAANSNYNNFIHGSNAGVSAQGDERWGDYFSVWQDPSTPSQVWFVASWQSGNGGYGWSTEFAKGTATVFG